MYNVYEREGGREERERGREERGREIRSPYSSRVALPVGLWGLLTLYMLQFPPPSLHRQ